jgi:hypothetical protein
MADAGRANALLDPGQVIPRWGAAQVEADDGQPLASRLKHEGSRVEAVEDA